MRAIVIADDTLEADGLIERCGITIVRSQMDRRTRPIESSPANGSRLRPHTPQTRPASLTMYDFSPGPAKRFGPSDHSSMKRVTLLSPSALASASSAMSSSRFTKRSTINTVATTSLHRHREYLLHDLPGSIYFQTRQQIGEVTRRNLEFQFHDGEILCDVD